MDKLSPQDVTKALNGKWYGTYGVAFCPAHNNTKTPALSVGEGEKGQLLLKCHAGCEFHDILAALRDGPTCHEKPALRRSSSAGDVKPQIAARTWEASKPIRGTLAETYLRCRGLKHLQASSLRFASSCFHPSRRRLPAIVAKVEGGPDFAIHRTYLSSDGVGKANIEPAKMMLGPCSGGAVRLLNENGPLVVAEGIETALSLASGILERPFRLWAALSTSGMKTLYLPSEPSRLIVASDGDRAGAAAAFDLAQRADRAGWEVELLQAPMGHDWNDVLLGNGGQHAET